MLLWSFEGAPDNHARFHNFGGLTGRETPLPIPNREVKPARADGTRRATSRESRSPPIYLHEAGLWPASLVSLDLTGPGPPLDHPERTPSALVRHREEPCMLRQVRLRLPAIALILMLALIAAG